MSILERWMELKKLEEETKVKRIELEEEIFFNYKDSLQGKASTTIRDGDFEINIKMNYVYKPAGNVILPESCYELKLSQTAVKNYAKTNPNEVETTINKPTIKVTRRI